MKNNWFFRTYLIQLELAMPPDELFSLTVFFQCLQHDAWELVKVKKPKVLMNLVSDKIIRP